MTFSCRNVCETRKDSFNGLASPNDSTPALTHTRAHAHTHKHAHTHTNTHAHKYIQANARKQAHRKGSFNELARPNDSNPAFTHSCTYTHKHVRACVFVLVCRVFQYVFRLWITIDTPFDVFQCVLQCIAVQSCVLHHCRQSLWRRHSHGALSRIVLKCAAVCVAVWWSVLQYVAVCYIACLECRKKVHEPTIFLVETSPKRERAPHSAHTYIETHM